MQKDNRTFENKLKAAKYHGGQDFLAGSPCIADTPLIVYDDLTEKQQTLIMLEYIAGCVEERDKAA